VRGEIGERGVFFNSSAWGKKRDSQGEHRECSAHNTHAHHCYLIIPGFILEMNKKVLNGGLCPSQTRFARVSMPKRLVEKEAAIEALQTTHNCQRERVHACMEFLTASKI